VNRRHFGRKLSLHGWEQALKTKACNASFGMSCGELTEIGLVAGMLAMDWRQGETWQVFRMVLVAESGSVGRLDSDEASDGWLV
jgi:hypothetical protein